ncbi:Pentatricopeptide repeat [Dillenia turbinata]|uniref:Pentatricopeptide repeat n=1 Tax=Dillenia turbinata TaxID=194707 RepID=A0AAN8WD10_9MAGN
MSSLQLTLPHSWMHHHQQSLRLCSVKCALTKQSERFLSSLSAAAADDFSAANRLIRKFVNSSSKAIALDALSNLLSPNTNYPNLTSLALPIYSTISEANWFIWNPKLVSELVALLFKQSKFNEAETLIYETEQKLGLRDRELAFFYCNLIESHSKHKSAQGVHESSTRLKELLLNSNSVYLKRKAYGSMISGYCAIDLPYQAEELMEEMKNLGIKPSEFEFRNLIHGFGKLGFFEDMERIVREFENSGFEVDTVCSNMILSSYGIHNDLAKMNSWLLKMKDLEIPINIRTYNSVLNSCPTIISLISNPKNIPTPNSIKELAGNLGKEEAMLIENLVGSSVLGEAMEWNPKECKLDLHGMHLSSAYLVMLEWIQEMTSRICDGQDVIPMEIIVVCGSGKHSQIRGESPVKSLVKEMMRSMKSPMRIDRKNVGCFVAKGKAVKDWLCMIK